MFCDLEQNGFEDQRAFQLAFELSMLGLSDNTLTSSSETPTITSLPSTFIVPDETRSKKSQNMTECVPVPSSEHVAEIVGRQGMSNLIPFLIFSLLFVQKDLFFLFPANIVF
ncbi:hypothetical protein O3M35_007552 [Rhynocoris fuscipes]|uniref:Uncharacterized protein n=1 Tax=Rhynocoris fuscipes TaxID=488301 RepID=A0AAW1DB92_9HEMI